MSEMNTTIENLKPIQGNNAANTLEAFVFEKTQKVNDVLVEAQRLINLYRQLNVLGPDFVPTFDKMLLSSKPDVQLALSNLSSILFALSGRSAALSNDAACGAERR